MDITCPICGCEFCLNEEILERGILCEQWGDCPNCGQYVYEYHFGFTQIIVGDESFEWAYSDTNEQSTKTSWSMYHAVQRLYRYYLKMENYSHG